MWVRVGAKRAGVQNTWSSEPLSESRAPAPADAWIRMAFEVKSVPGVSQSEARLRCLLPPSPRRPKQTKFPRLLFPLESGSLVPQSEFQLQVIITNKPCQPRMPRYRDMVSPPQACWFCGTVKEDTTITERPSTDWVQQKGLQPLPGMEHFLVEPVFIGYKFGKWGQGRLRTEQWPLYSGWWIQIILWSLEIPESEKSQILWLE